MTKTIEDFINRATYDSESQTISGVDGDGKPVLIAMVRGWNVIQDMFRDDKGVADRARAAEYQDEMGEWIADAINQKLRDPNEGFPMGMGRY